MSKGIVVLISAVALCCIGESQASLDLQISADIENVSKFGVPLDHTFFLRLRCSNCHEDTPNAVGVSRDMIVEGIRGASVNAQVKCKGCSRMNDISLSAEAAEGGYEADRSEWQRLATFEFRGWDPIEYEVRDGYFVVAQDGKTRFDNVDLSEDWCEVDEEGRPVMITNVRSKFVPSPKSGNKKK